jgi:C-terminal processing protease CtpA/Prc
VINKKILSVFILSAFTLSACGSGGSSSSTAEPLTETPPTWIQGVFANESNFKNRCETPRTGVDINGNAYQDQAGSKLYEKHWLRSWSNNTYLWYDEIIDNNIAAIEDPVDYFETLRTTAETSSGAKKDKFSYSQNTAEYQQLVSSGAALGYGFRVTFIKSTVPREGRIAYVEPNSPASDAGLSRGDEVIAIDGVDAINGVGQSNIATLNAGLFPEEVGEKHFFEIRDLEDGVARTVELAAEAVTNEPVKNTRVIDNGFGKVGYLALNTFGTNNAEAALVDAFNILSSQPLDDLVLDLRYNGGGILNISSQLAYMIAGPQLSNGKSYGRAVFNNKHPLVNPVTGNPITDRPFFNSSLNYSVPSGQSLPSVNLNRVYVLTSGRTCSASEALINGLRGIDVEVVLIGGTTCGKPYAFYPTDNCGTTYLTVQIRGENAKGFGDYADGFTANNSTGSFGERILGCQVTEDVRHPLGNVEEVMLKAALEYRNNSTCPAVPASRSGLIDGESDLKNDPAYIKRELLEQIRLDHLLYAEQ